jgi:uncharacterized membrane protein
MLKKHEVVLCDGFYTCQSLRSFPCGQGDFMNAKTIIMIVAIVTTGLSAGVFFAFQVSIIPAFKLLPDAVYIAAMQSINDIIQNDPFFLFCFIGAGLFLAIAAFMYRTPPGSPRFFLLVAAAVLYIVGVLGVSFAANIPLNDTLAGFSLSSATAHQAALARASYEDPWNAWNLVRTYASVAALALVVIACFLPSTRRFLANIDQKPPVNSGESFS